MAIAINRSGSKKYVPKKKKKKKKKYVPKRSSTSAAKRRMTYTYKGAKKNTAAKKKRAKKALAKSTKARVKRMNSTYKAMQKNKKKKKKKKVTVKRKSSPSRTPLKKGTSYRKGKVVKKAPGKSVYKRTGGKVSTAKKKTSSKKKKKGGGGRKYPGSIQAKDLQKLQHRASLLAQEQYQPALDEIARQIRTIERDRDRNVGVQQQFGQKGDERLAAAGQWLDQVLSRQAGTVKDIFGAAGQNIEGAYASAEAAQQSAGDQVLGNMQASAAQLGLSEALFQPENELKAEILAAQAETRGDYANSMANIETLGAGEQARAQDVVSASARQSAQDRANLQTEVAGGIASIQRQAAEQLAEGQYATRDVMNQRALSEKTNMIQLRQEEKERRRQKFMDLLYADVQKNTMKLQNAQLKLEKQASKFNRGQAKAATKLQRQQFTFNKQLALRQLRNEEAALRAEIASANSPQARLQAQLELEKVRADINYTNSRTAAQLAKAAKYRSSAGKKKSKNWSKPLPGPGERPGGR